MSNTKVQLIIAGIQLFSMAVIIGIVILVIRFFAKHIDDKQLREDWEKDQNPHLPGR